MIPLRDRLAVAGLISGAVVLAGWGRPTWLVAACVAPWWILVAVGRWAER